METATPRIIEDSLTSADDGRVVWSPAKPPLYEVRLHNLLIATTLLEYADPPMGFVGGLLYPTSMYYACLFEPSELSIHTDSERIPHLDLVITDYSEALNEIYIDVLMDSWESYECFFSHHQEAYENRFAEPA